MRVICSMCKLRRLTAIRSCWLVPTVAQSAEEFRYGSETRETPRVFVFSLTYFSRRAREFLQNLGRIRKIGRACRIANCLDTSRGEEAPKRLDETIVYLLLRRRVPASPCWNIGCFESKRFSVFAAAVISCSLDGWVLTLQKTS